VIGLFVVGPINVKFFQTKVNKRGEKSWDIHFWLGSQTSQVNKNTLISPFHKSVLIARTRLARLQSSLSSSTTNLAVFQFNTAKRKNTSHNYSCRTLKMESDTFQVASLPVSSMSTPTPSKKDCSRLKVPEIFE
jgi:hypothetical protein